MNLSKLLDNKWCIKLINIGAIALYVDYNISSLLSINPIGDSILLWKITATGEHHLIDFFGILICFFVLLPIFYKNPKTRKVFALIAFFTNWFIIGYHETLWYLARYVITIISPSYYYV